MWRLTVADWSKVTDRVDVTVFNQPFATAEAAASALKDFEIICAMRERTPFPRTHVCGAAQPETPDHLGHAQCRASIWKPPRTTRWCCAARNGAAIPTAPLTMGLILELTRNIGRENARMHAGEPLQKFVGMEIEGRTLGVIGLRQARHQGVRSWRRAFGMNVIAWSPNLTPEKCKEVGVSYATKEELFSHRRHRHHPCGAEPALARAGRALRNWRG